MYTYCTPGSKTPLNMEEWETLSLVPTITAMFSPGKLMHDYSTAFKWFKAETKCNLNKDMDQVGDLSSKCLKMTILLASELEHWLMVYWKQIPLCVKVWLFCREILLAWHLQTMVMWGNTKWPAEQIIQT